MCFDRCRYWRWNRCTYKPANESTDPPCNTANVPNVWWPELEEFGGYKACHGCPNRNADNDTCMLLQPKVYCCRKDAIRKEMGLDDVLF